MTNYDIAGSCAIVPNMPNYRRAFVPGGCWFFTVNLLERRQTLLADHIDGFAPGCFRWIGLEIPDLTASEETAPRGSGDMAAGADGKQGSGDLPSRS